jgi:hypothetical protein
MVLAGYNCCALVLWHWAVLGIVPDRINHSDTNGSRCGRHMDHLIVLAHCWRIKSIALARLAFWLYSSNSVKSWSYEKEGRPSRCNN